MDRQVNQNKSWNVQKDLLPLYGLSSGKTPFMDVIAASAKVKAEDTLAHDLYLYSRVPGTIWGEEREFVSSPKLDDLQCALPLSAGSLSERRKNPFPSMPSLIMKKWEARQLRAPVRHSFTMS